ncbi:hypothetical protein AAE478_003232 [Parahypoxylon ruwenzoriense]
MTVPDHQPSSFRRTVYATLQAIFAVTLFTIFVIAWLVQGGSIKLPQWAIAWNGASHENQVTYAAALVPAVCVCAMLFFGAGFWMTILERRQDRR